MHVEEALDLLDDVVEAAGLVARRGLEGVAVHRVADPGHLHALGGDLLDQRREAVADLVGAEAGHEGEPARGVVGVEARGVGQGVVGRGGGAELDADRVLDAREQLDVGAVELAGALADPHEVGGHVVRQVGARVDARQRLLVLQQQGLVAGVEVDPVELVGVGADGLHEGQRALDLVGHCLVALAEGRGLHEVGVPGVHLAQVGVAARDEGAHEVEGGGRVVVDLHEPLGVGDAGLGGEVVAVDGVAAVGRERHAVAGLLVGAARLGVLAGEPAELHDRHRGGVGQDDGHLQQHPQLVADVVGGDAGEGLGAVAALEQERLAARHGRDLLGQVVALTREHQRRRGAQSLDRGVDGCGVGIAGLLERAHRVQLVERRDRTVPGGAAGRGVRRSHRSRVRRCGPLPRTLTGA
ncbi:hypothetical protein NOZE110980_16960 [Nocardioides zeicaulis]